MRDLTGRERTWGVATVSPWSRDVNRGAGRRAPRHQACPRRPRLGLRELWRFRELLYFLAWRDLKVRYKQTLLGVVWAVLQPLMYMVVFTLFFGRCLDVYSTGPYALLALSGLGALALLRERGHARVEQPRRQRVADHEGLLPAPARAARADPRGARRPRARRSRRAARRDGRATATSRPAARAGRRSRSCCSPRRPRSASAPGSRR